MLTKIFAAVITGILIIHGLIHLIGFRVYGQGVSLAEMPFKTTFLNGALYLGEPGTRIYGVFWLLPTIGFIVAGAGFLAHTGWWQPALIAASLISILLTGMDWGNAFRGTLIDLGLLVFTLLSPLVAHLGIRF